VRRQELARVHDPVRIEDAPEARHEIEIGVAELERHARGFVDSDAVLAGDAAAHGEARAQELVVGLLGPLELARLEVVDNGTGIPEEAKQKLFEPYFSTKRSGTGLGLAIVSNIISDHNGYIRVKDNFPAGTRFIIELPVKAAAI